MRNALFFVTLSFAPAAVADVAPPGPSCSCGGTRCTSNDDCGEIVCNRQNGECEPCSDALPCTEGQQCVDGQCEGGDGQAALSAVLPAGVFALAGLALILGRRRRP
jgi:MYXO-CTERM domain-containing protein